MAKKNMRQSDRFVFDLERETLGCFVMLKGDIYLS